MDFRYVEKFLGHMFGPIVCSTLMLVLFIDVQSAARAADGVRARVYIQPTRKSESSEMEQTPGYG